MASAGDLEEVDDCASIWRFVSMQRCAAAVFHFEHSLHQQSNILFTCEPVKTRFWPFADLIEHLMPCFAYRLFYGCSSFEHCCFS